MTTGNDINTAMLLLAEHPEVRFIGQNVAYDGNVMFKHLEGVPMEKRLELPVAEEMQMGMGIGLSLMGYIPVSIYPRMDFLMCAMNQLVNHLDKLPIMSQGVIIPHVIIKTKVGARTPLDAGPQHTQDHTAALIMMLKSVVVERLEDERDAPFVYGEALRRYGSTLVVETF